MNSPAPVIALVTCRRWPDVSASDGHYAAALTARGASVIAAPWNGPLAPFLTADAVVLRSNWDYHYAPTAFGAWLDALVAAGVTVFNAPALVRWNLHKRYLLALARAGARTPGTVVAPATAAAVADTLATTGWPRAVLKPAHGASGHLVSLVTAGTLPDLSGYAAEGRAELIVQEYVPEVARDGEWSCVFFGGVFSHALLKRPAAGDFRVNSQYQGETTVTSPPAFVVEQGAAVLALLPQSPLYARIDGVARDDHLVLMEVEVNEPGLALDRAPGAADRFAVATLAALAAGRASA